MKFQIIVFSICILALGCSKDKDNEGGSGVALEFAEILDCHQMANWTEAKVEDALNGDWVWERQYNPWTQEYDYDIYKDVKLTFIEDKKTLERNDSSGLRTSIWDFDDLGWCDISIETQQMLEEFTGCLRLCDDHLMFDNTAVDGVANIYRKQ